MYDTMVFEGEEANKVESNNDVLKVALILA